VPGDRVDSSGLRISHGVDPAAATGGPLSRPMIPVAAGLLFFVSPRAAVTGSARARGYTSRPS
jgi:hypothetical protein